MFATQFTTLQATLTISRPARLLLPAALLLLGVLCALPVQVVAQATGQVSGAVSDQTGRVIPGAKAELVSTATGQTRDATAGSDGAYSFPLVAPGMYQLRTTATGFATTITKDVQVQVNSTSHVDVKMKVGSATTEVTVTGAIPLVETSNATLGNVVNQESVVDLPLNGRNFAQLGTLIPGVVAAPGGLGGATGNATIGGFGDTTAATT